MGIPATGRKIHFDVHSAADLLIVPPFLPFDVQKKTDSDDR
jgi:hypothetical protein